MASDIILSNANGKTITLQNPDTNNNDIIIETDKLVTSTGDTGGTGSGGAGNQYVVITVDGVSYKVLHDGIV